MNLAVTTASAEKRIGAAPLMACAIAAVGFGAAVYVDRPLLFAGAVASVAFLGAIMVRPLVGLCAALALAPLEAAGRVIATMPAFTWAKVALAFTLLAVLAAALVRDDRIELPARFWALAVIPFLGVMSTLAGGYGLVGDTLTGVASMGSNVLLVLLAYHLLTTKPRILAGILSVVAGSVPVVVFGLVEIVTKEAVFDNPMFSEPLWAPGTTDMFRITSTFFDPNALGRYLLFAMLWTLAALWVPALKRARPVLLGVLAVQAYCLVNTFSRAAFLVFAVVAVPFVFYALVHRFRAAAVGVFGLLAVGAVSVAGPVIAVVLRRFDDPTAGGRLGILEAAVPAMAGSPVFGYGREHVAVVLGGFIGEVTDPHNLFTEVVLSLGVIGVLVIGAWAVPAARRILVLWRAGNPYARLLALPIIGVVAFNMSLHGMEGYEIWVPIAFVAPILRLEGCERGADACVSH